MSNNEHPINLMYEGIADLLAVKGEKVSVIDNNPWQVISINYGGFTYVITKYNNITENIGRVKIGGNHEQKEPNN